MTVPGADCPECDARLTERGCPKCGWASAGGRTAAACADCHEPARANALTDGPDGRARCASCHAEALKRAAAPADDAEVAQCRAEFRRLMDRASVRWATRR